jgi:NADPH:quinone reductase-like Zn-dependent oxidoreductase
MRAFIVPEFGNPGHVGEKAKPEAGEGELLVRVRAAGVNAMDPIFRAGFAKDFMEHRFPLTLAVTRAEHAAYVRELGATDVVDYSAGDVTEQLRSKVPQGLAGIVDVFHDAQGLLALAPAVRAGGRIATPAAPGAEQAFAGQPVSAHSVQAATDRVAELGELAAEGRLRVDVEIVPLEQAADAIHRQSTRGNRGKLVLTIG